MLTIELDGQELQAEPGTMIIEVADQAGIYIPRFCYHNKLSIAANCRMCLVEVERASKPLPACATPIVDGMKIHTGSEVAVGAQKDTLEFLLINHPLDCPICDQGGECPLQDQALGYGGHASRFEEKKRVVPDHSIGPLIETEMTRCIHCTRCVRFGEEIAGVMELGITGRGEHLKIDTFFESAMDSEVSGNVIDLCPVGALTSKPYRFTARSWELIDHDSISPHDCVGTNINIQTLRGEVKRVLPRDNESINECWIADRDRYSYEALNGDNRLGVPMVRTDEGMVETDWQSALDTVVNGLRSVMKEHGANNLGALISPTSTFEEFYLAQKLMRGLGSDCIDHRLRQIDFRSDEDSSLYPGLGMSIEEFAGSKAFLLIGSNIRKEQPLLGLRVRKAVLNGARAAVVNPMSWNMNFELDSSVVTAPGVMPYALGRVLEAVCKIKSVAFPADVSEEFLSGASEFSCGDDCRGIAQMLCESNGRTVIVLGHSAIAHPMYSCIRRLAQHIAEITGASFGTLPAANSAAGWLAGCIPHRTANGASVAQAGCTTRQMVHNPRAAYLLFNVEPSKDMADGLHSENAIANAEFVVSFQSFSEIPDYVDVVLPIAPFTENAGTFINCEGRIQKSVAATSPFGEARPGWKILRVLGNLLEVPGFEYVTIDEILEEASPAEGLCEQREAGNNGQIPCIEKINPREPGRFELISDPLIYAVDPIVRRADALQSTADADASWAGINPADMETLGLAHGASVAVRHDLYTIHTNAVADPRVPLGCVYFPAGMDISPSAALGAELRVEQVQGE